MNFAAAEFSQILLPVVAAALFGFLFGVYRDKRSRRSDATIQFLLNAYKEIEFGGCRDRIPNKDEFERAIASVFLLGNKRQVYLAKRFMIEFSDDGPGADATELLRALREDLRKELGLEAVGRELSFLRIERTKDEAERMGK